MCERDQKMSKNRNLRFGLIFATTCLLTGVLTGLIARVEAGQAGQSGVLHITPADIGGVVTSSKGPEAGVWVIAETNDLGTKLIKIVVTDDQGRYLLPEMPKANYRCGCAATGL